MAEFLEYNEAGSAIVACPPLAVSGCDRRSHCHRCSAIADATNSTEEILGTGVSQTMDQGLYLLYLAFVDPLSWTDQQMDRWTLYSLVMVFPEVHG